MDTPISIGPESTCSQPSTVRDMLKLLSVPVGARVLDVGSGSGWSTALLAHLVGPHGQVVGVELEADLVRFGTENLARCARPWATIQLAVPGSLGDPTRAPYDRILVSAMAAELPRSLIAQLAPGGIIVIPVAKRMVRVRLDETGTAQISTHGRYGFVPLR